MVDIPYNFGKIEACLCGEPETMSHIYACQYLNKGENYIEYEKVYNGKVSEHIEVMRRFEQNMIRK